MKKHNDQKLKDALGDMIDDFRLKPKLHQTRLREIWASMMGPQIDRYTQKISVRHNKLFVTIDSAPLRQELSYGREKILSNLNEALGEQYLTDVIIR